MSQEMSYEKFKFEYKNQNLYSKRNLGCVTLYAELHNSWLHLWSPAFHTYNDECRWMFPKLSTIGKKECTRKAEGLGADFMS
jgi:hypothetical protein